MSELLTDEEVKQVFEIDDMILLNEFLALLDTALADNIPELLGKVQFSFNGFKETEEAHLSMLMMWTSVCSNLTMVSVFLMQNESIKPRTINTSLTALLMHLLSVGDDICTF